MLELEVVVKHYRGAGEEVRAVDVGDTLTLPAPAGEIAREGLAQLATISELFVLAAILAMAAALASASWQRRDTLAVASVPARFAARVPPRLALEHG